MKLKTLKSAIIVAERLEKNKRSLAALKTQLRKKGLEDKAAGNMFFVMSNPHVRDPIISLLTFKKAMEIQIESDVEYFKKRGAEWNDSMSTLLLSLIDSEECEDDC